MIEIREVQTKRDLKRFVRFEYDLYKECEQWIPPLYGDEVKTLRKDKNPSFEYSEAGYWLALRGNKVVGRIAGIINRRYIEKWNNRYARFGWVDFIDDEEVSNALFETVEGWAREKGMVGIHGPLGFTDFDKEGMLVEGFDELGTMVDIYNYPYYKDHLERLGYKKDADWVEFEVKTPKEIPEKALRVEEIVLKRNKLRIVKAENTKELLPYAKKIFDVIDKTYVNLYGFAPLSERQVDMYIKQYFPHIVLDYVVLVVDMDDMPVAFVIGFPSLGRALKKSNGRLFPIGWIYMLHALSKKNRYIDLLLAAVRPDFQGKGVNALLMTEFTKTAIANNLISAETSRELEDNRLIQAHWDYYEARQHKRRRCYLKKLGPSA
jgi:GNAT superfamily N-acetyltransferase